MVGYFGPVDQQVRRRGTPVALVIAADPHRDATARVIDGITQSRQAEQSGELLGRPADMKWASLPVPGAERRWRDRIEQPGQYGRLGYPVVGGLGCHHRDPMASA